MSKILSTKVQLSEPQPKWHTKVAIASALGKEDDTIRKYAAWARAFIPAYANYCRGANGRLKDRLPLNDYQRWVVEQVSKLADRARNDETVKSYLIANAKKFSEEAYEQYIHQRTSA